MAQRTPSYSKSFLPVLLDVTETIRFSYSRRKETTDLEMTYQKIYQTLEQEGTDR